MVTLIHASLTIAPLLIILFSIRVLKDFFAHLAVKDLIKYSFPNLMVLHQLNV